MKAEFSKTVDILVKAYLNDTLEHQNCKACAVGNIVSAANNLTLRKVAPYSFHGFTVECKEMENWFSGTFRVVETEQIRNTGYSVDDLRHIEIAFESVYYETGDDKMYQGLCRVVDVLAEIHGISLEQKESAKSLFVKP